LLPAWVQALSQLLPLTHALTGLRLALAGRGFGDVGQSIGVLVVMALVFLPLGLIAATKATQRARREGSLVVY
jgi:ABC-type multidrug transport system permease subunit